MTPGSFVGNRYRLLEEVGRGATSVVYRAEDTVLRTDVALKMLAPHLARDPAAIGDLRRELLASRTVTDEGVAQVTDLCEEGERAYVVMELGRSGTLKDHLLLRGALSAELLDLVLERLAKTLAACHAKGVLHRDLKPSNVLFDPVGRTVKLIDFGVARLGGDVSTDETGSVVGTPEYMAPEQFTDAAPDPRSDLYAAGVLLYEAATGIPPVTGTTIPEIARRVQEGVRVRPTKLGARIGPATEAIVMKLLAADPAMRFQTADELVLALEGQTLSPLSTQAAAPGGAGTCPACGVERVEGIPSCAVCGEGLDVLDRPGAWWVSVTGELRGRRDGDWKRRDPARSTAKTYHESGSSMAQVTSRTRLRQLLPASFQQAWPGSTSFPFVALMDASEQLARWVAAELRKEGLSATAQRAPVGRMLATVTVLVVLATVLVHLALVGWFGLTYTPRENLQTQVLAVTTLCLLLVIVTAARQATAIFRPWLFRVPLGGSPLAGGLLGAVERQSRLRSRRCRAIGRDLLVEVSRRRGEPGGAGTALDAGYGALERLDSLLARERPAPGATHRDTSRWKDDVVATTQEALAVVTLLRRRQWRDQRPGMTAAGPTWAELLEDAQPPYGPGARRLEMPAAALSWAELLEEAQPPYAPESRSPSVGQAGGGRW